MKIVIISLSLNFDVFRNFFFVFLKIPKENNLENSKNSINDMNKVPNKCNSLLISCLIL